MDNIAAPERRFGVTVGLGPTQKVLLPASQFMFSRLPALKLKAWQLDVQGIMLLSHGTWYPMTKLAHAHGTAAGTDDCRHTATEPFQDK